jgi:hypothetical protein
VRLEIGHYLAEGGAARLLGGFDVDLFLRHREILRHRVVLEQLKLGTLSVFTAFCTRKCVSHRLFHLRSFGEAELLSQAPEEFDEDRS